MEGSGRTELAFFTSLYFYEALWNKFETVPIMESVLIVIITIKFPWLRKVCNYANPKSTGPAFHCFPDLFSVLKTGLHLGKRSVCKIENFLWLPRRFPKSQGIAHLWDTTAFVLRAFHTSEDCFCTYPPSRRNLKYHCAWRHCNLN